MAKATMMYPHKFEVSLKEIGENINGVCEKALKAGGDVAFRIVHGNLAQVIGNDTKKESRSTGELLDSLGISPIKVDKNGIINIKIGFNEPRKEQHEARGKRSYYVATNAMIANVIEYGKSGQPAKPFMARSKRQAKAPVIEAMRKVIEQELKKYK